jgi:hypothetical protein
MLVCDDSGRRDRLQHGEVISDVGQFVIHQTEPNAQRLAIASLIQKPDRRTAA